MRGFTGLLLFLGFLVVLSLSQSVSFYTDWLWFQETGFTRVFTTALAVKLLLAAVSGGLFFLVVYLNVKTAARTVAGLRFLELDNAIELPSPELIDPLVRRLLLPACLLLGLMAAPAGAGQWESALLFLNAVPFGIPDPVFGHDIGFFIFRLPFLTAAHHSLALPSGLAFP